MLQQLKYVLFIIYLAIVSCKKAPNYSSTPHIEYDTVSKTTTYPGDTSQTIKLKFEDGEGDILLILYKDNRKLIVDPNFDTIFTPEIKLKNNIATDVSGFINFQPYNTVPVLTPPTDSFFYIIKLMDKQGHISNQVLTDTLIMQ